MPKPDISNSVIAAKDLLGWKLVHESETGRTSGYIVETEAYDSAVEDVLGGSKVWMEPGFEPEAITETNRIGISKAKDKLWRFYISGNPHISKR